MFFVACSISPDLTEFERAVHAFVSALTPDAPFAAGFMVESEGYWVGERFFPAVRVTNDHIRSALAGVAYDVHIADIDTDAPLRQGYGGMSLATGRASALA
jgi:hypothetical protein